MTSLLILLLCQEVCYSIQNGIVTYWLVDTIIVVSLHFDAIVKRF